MLCPCCPHAAGLSRALPVPGWESVPLQPDPRAGGPATATLPFPCHSPAVQKRAPAGDSGSRQMSLPPRLCQSLTQRSGRGEHLLAKRCSACLKAARGGCPAAGNGHGQGAPGRGVCAGFGVVHQPPPLCLLDHCRWQGSGQPARHTETQLFQVGSSGMAGRSSQAAACPGAPGTPASTFHCSGAMRVLGTQSKGGARAAVESNRWGEWKKQIPSVLSGW